MNGIVPVDVGLYHTSDSFVGSSVIMRDGHIRESLIRGKFYILQ